MAKRKRRANKSSNVANSKSSANAEPIKVSEDNRRIFEAARDHLNEASLKNLEAFDKAILTLSSGGLFLTLSFSQFLVPIDQAVSVFYLKLGWLLFTLAMILTLISFLTSNSAIVEQRKYIYKYYIEENDEFANAKNFWGIITFWINRIAAVVFLMAVMFTVMYVWENTNEVTSMAEQSGTKGYEVPANQPANTGGKPKSK